MENEITQVKAEKSQMASQQKYIVAIQGGLESIIGKTDSYQAICGYNILNAINTLLAKEGKSNTSADVDKESVNNAIKFAMVYRLNTDNKELFVSTRKEKRKDARGLDVWVTKVEIKPQANGLLKIVQKYGIDVRKVHNAWIVHEGDDFTYPMHQGIKLVEPTWTPKSYDGKVIRVVVPIEYTDGSIDYRIAERESVAVNLKAQIKQSLITDKLKQKQVLELIKDMTLEQLLTDKTIAENINDTYIGLSSEEMITTKLINNAIKRVPVDYGSALAKSLMESTYDNADVYQKQSAADLVDQAIPQIERQDAVKEIEFDNDGVVISKNKNKVLDIPTDVEAKTVEEMFVEE